MDQSIFMDRSVVPTEEDLQKALGDIYKLSDFKLVFENKKGRYICKKR